MPSPEYARLTIDFDLQADPIAGVVHHGDGHSQPFAGWMALTRTIELTLQAARLHRPSPSSGPGEDHTTAPSDPAIAQPKTPGQHDPADAPPAAIPDHEPPRQEPPR